MMQILTVQEGPRNTRPQYIYVSVHKKHIRMLKETLQCMKGTNLGCECHLSALLSEVQINTVNVNLILYASGDKLPLLSHPW